MSIIKSILIWILGTIAGVIVSWFIGCVIVLVALLVVITIAVSLIAVFVVAPFLICWDIFASEFFKHTGVNLPKMVS